MKTKTLIENLKKEIEEGQTPYPDGVTLGGFPKIEYLSPNNVKKAQLQFAEKLIKAIKDDVKEWFKNKNTGVNRRDGWVTINEYDIKELNKILDESLKC